MSAGPDVLVLTDFHGGDFRLPVDRNVFERAARATNRQLCGLLTLDDVGELFLKAVEVQDFTLTFAMMAALILLRNRDESEWWKGEQAEFAIWVCHPGGTEWSPSLDVPVN